MTRTLLPLAVLTGLAIAWMDGQPGWDDTGISAMALLLAAVTFGLVGRTRPWLWALAVGAWIPLRAVVNGGAWSMLFVLAIPLAGAYAGSGLRRLAGPTPDRT
jgi:hypothetical protein